MAGAILVLGRDLVMVPKLIHPLPPNEPRTPTSNGELDEEPPTPHPLNDTWMQVMIPSPFPNLINLISFLHPKQISIAFAAEILLDSPRSDHVLPPPS